MHALHQCRSCPGPYLASRWRSPVHAAILLHHRATCSVSMLSTEAHAQCCIRPCCTLHRGITCHATSAVRAHAPTQQHTTRQPPSSPAPSSRLRHQPAAPTTSAAYAWHMPPLQPTRHVSDPLAGAHPAADLWCTLYAHQPHRAHQPHLAWGNASRQLCLSSSAPRTGM